MYEIKSKNLSHNRDDVTVVDYTIQRSDDGAVETLKSPKRVDLERSLSTVGKTLYSRAPVPPPKVNNKLSLRGYFWLIMFALLHQQAISLNL